MDRIDTMLEEFFAPEAPPRLSARLLGALRTKRADLDALAEKFRIEATERGVFRLQLGRGSHGASARARAHAERAREELRERTCARPSRRVYGRWALKGGRALRPIRTAAARPAAPPTRWRR